MKNFDIDSKSKISSGFQVPEGYFDSLPAQVMLKIQQPERPAIQLFNNKFKAFLAAASIIIIGLLLTQFNFATPTTSSDDIENYIAYQTSITQYDLVNILDENDIENMKIDYDLTQQEVSTFLASQNNLDLLINE